MELCGSDTTNDLITSDSAVPEQVDGCLNLTFVSEEPVIMDNSGDFDVLEEMEQHEEKIKREKCSRRRRKASKNREVLCSHCYEGIKKNVLQYSREQMEDLSFADMEEQQKKWVEVYCGLEPVLVQEYDGLVRLDKNNHKHVSERFNFDPRAQFPNSLTVENASVSSITDEMACFSVEEANEDDESEEDYASLLRPAFLVTGEPDFDSGPPQDGLEYLRRVRWESARIPKVVKAVEVNQTKEQSFYMPQIPDIMKCSETFLSRKEWEESFLRDFSELRKAIGELDTENGCSENSIKLHSQDNLLVHMLEETTDTRSKAEDDDSCPSESCCKSEASDIEVIPPHSPKTSNHKDDLPSLSKLLKMSSAGRVATLRRRINHIQNASMVSYQEGLWLFALCATVDQPLDGDATAAIRSLLRKCASLRASKSQVDEEVVILNILIAISGLYFGQQEK